MAIQIDLCGWIGFFDFFDFSDLATPQNKSLADVTKVTEYQSPCADLWIIKKSNDMEPHLYNVTVTWNNDRKGTMCSPDLNINGNVAACVDVATPPEFPKGIPGIWSPEHLFTAAVGSCLMTTFLAIAENSKLEFISFSCNSRGKLEKVDGKLAMSEVVLEPVLTIRDEASREKGLKVLQKSEANCLITNSVACKVSMEPQIIVQQESVSV